MKLCIAALANTAHIHMLQSSQPVQSLADRYARKLKSRDVVSKATKTGEEEEEQEASLGEQANILQVLGRCQYTRIGMSEVCMEVFCLTRYCF